MEDLAAGQEAPTQEQARVVAEPLRKPQLIVVTGRQAIRDLGGAELPFQ